MFHSFGWYRKRSSNPFLASSTGMFLALYSAISVNHRVSSDFSSTQSEDQVKPESPAGFPPLKVKKISIYSARGPRSTMEDRYFCSPDNRFFAVYDGHGGAAVAELARKHLYSEFALEFAKISGPESVRAKEAFEKSFATFEARVIKNQALDNEGSTAIAVYVGETELVAANVGDSRAILCRGSKVIDLSVDHKPNSPSEKKRIEDLGGTVEWYGFKGPDKMPVPGMGAYRMNGNLSLSRAFGDRSEIPLVTAVPDVECFHRTIGKDRYIVLASDGLWDVMSSQDVMDFIRQIMSRTEEEVAEGRRRGGGIAPAPQETVKSVKSDLEIKSERRQEKMAKVGGVFSVAVVVD